MTPPESKTLQCGAYFPSTVESIFREADINKDGIVSGQEAVNFFLSTDIDKKRLSEVWEAATSSQPGGLTPYQFSRALRLVSLLQTGCVFTNEFVEKALDPRIGLQLPTPKIGEQYLRCVPAEAGLGPTSTRASPETAKAEVRSPHSLRPHSTIDRGVLMTRFRGYQHKFIVFWNIQAIESM
jgi:hypothetical protein